GFVGEGAMGRVYRAVDQQLGRTVALKFMRSDDPEQVTRFQREARSQARIEHENVCRVYEVGEVEGNAYIAMQLIDGRSLRDLAPELTLEQKVRVIMQVAEAAQAAHSMGVIHRDIKPANVMVEIEEDGALHPFVLDFGIAREVGDQSLTATGTVVGTPAFMAPEQVRGGPENIDRRVDVYALGATLYHLIAGKAPFEGTTRLETMLRVLEDEAQPLRQLERGVPADLETIVATCLEKEPQRRYGSARSLAEDLQRYLDGEPIEARPAGFAYRVGKRMRKHKALTAVVAVATAAVLILSAALVSQHFQARQRQALAQQFGQELERIDGMLRQVRMLPLHDVAPVEDMVRRRMQDIEEKMQSMGAVGFGPGSHALGIGHLDLGEFEAARDRLQAAWDSGYRSPELDGALGRVLGEMYLEEAEAAARIRNADLRAARRQEIELEFLQPALTHLGSGRAGAEEMELHQAALKALLERRFDDAIEAAQASYERYPWLYESMRLEAEILVARAKDAEETGRTESARADYLAAGEVYTRALDVGRSDAVLYQGEAARLIRLFRLEGQNGTLQDDLAQRALKMADAAEIARPDDARPFNLRSKVYWLKGEYELQHGLNPIDSLDEAARLALRAAEMEPESPQAPIDLGMIYRLQASYQRRQGKDPRPFVEMAISACRRALSIDPDSAVAWINLGTANYLMAEYELASGLDPLASLERAADGYEKSIRVRPTFAAHSNAGLVHWQRAGYQWVHGQDPEASLEAAAACFERASKLNPTQGQVQSNQGLILLERAERAAEVGGDPTPWVERSLAVLKRAVELMPNLPAAHNNLGNAFKMQAVVEMTSGSDPRPSLDRAVASYRRAIELDPSLAYQYNNLGFSWEKRAEFESIAGGDPRPALREARSNLRQALQIDPTMAYAHHNLALCCRTEAEYLVQHDQDPSAVIDRGRRAARAAIKNNPNHYDLHLMRGELELVAAQWAVEHGESPEGYLTEAGRHFAVAEELNPKAPAIFLRRARSAVLGARWLVSQAVDPTEILASGFADADRGLEIDPTDADFLLVKGKLHLVEARAATGEAERRRAASQAVEAFESARKANSLLEATCSPLIAEASHGSRNPG
ncbi:MAG: protein kinase, partial [Thermoanaerobaculales bacterium]